MQTIPPHHTHLWLTELLPSCNTTSFTTLSAVELAHAEQFARADARHRYLQVRTEVRRCLSLYAGLAPEDLHFTHTSDGKPLLTNTTQPLHFNLSHSGTYLALAINSSNPIGIDLELTSPRRKWQAIAERYFHPDELVQLMTLPEADRHSHFYRWWTLKEAFFKARGTGISTGLDKAIFSLSNATITCKLADQLQENAQAWWFQLWRWQSNYHLALASSTLTTQVDFYRGGSDDLKKCSEPLTTIATSIPAHPT